MLSLSSKAPTGQGSRQGGGRRPCLRLGQGRGLRVEGLAYALTTEVASYYRTGRKEAELAIPSVRPSMGVPIIPIPLEMGGGMGMPVPIPTHPPSLMASRSIHPIIPLGLRTPPSIPSHPPIKDGGGIDGAA